MRLQILQETGLNVNIPATFELRDPKAYTRRWIEDVSSAALEAANDFVRQIEEAERTRLQQAHTAYILHQRALQEHQSIRDRFARSTAVPAYIDPILKGIEGKTHQYLEEYQELLPKEGLPVPEHRVNEVNQEDWPESVVEPVALNSALLPPTHLREDRPHPSVVATVGDEDLEVNIVDEIEFVE